MKDRARTAAPAGGRAQGCRDTLASRHLIAAWRRCPTPCPPATPSDELPQTHNRSTQGCSTKSCVACSSRRLHKCSRRHCCPGKLYRGGLRVHTGTRQAWPERPPPLAAPPPARSRCSLLPAGSSLHRSRSTRGCSTKSCLVCSSRRLHKCSRRHCCPGKLYRGGLRVHTGTRQALLQARLAVSVRQHLPAQAQTP